MEAEQHQARGRQPQQSQMAWSEQSQSWAAQQYQLYHFQMAYYQQLQQYYPGYYGQQLGMQAYRLPNQTVTTVPKQSANQKRKARLRQKQQQLEQQKKAIGERWVKLECKELVSEVQKLEEQQQKRREKRKQRLSHLIEIHRELQKMRDKMGVMDSTVGQRKQLKEVMERHNIRMGRTKKPSRVKQLAQLYKERCAKQRKHSEMIIKPGQKKTGSLPEDGFVTQSDDQQKEEAKLLKQSISQATRDKATPITYNKVGKLTGYHWNGIELREWVDHMPSVNLQDKLLVFVNKLAYQQAVKKLKLPLKFKKRILSGFNEVSRTLATINPQKRCRCLVVALNIKRNPFRQGSDSEVIDLIDQALKLSVPVLHCSNRSKLGRAFIGKFGPRVSVISIVNYQGNQQQFEEIIDQWQQLKRVYQQTPYPWELLEKYAKRDKPFEVPPMRTEKE